VRGTYREAQIIPGVKRVTCEHCGYAKDVPPEESQSFEYWFRLAVDGHQFWARNESHLRALRDYLEGNLDRNRSGFYALPKWMLESRTRAKILRSIDQFLVES